MCLKEYTIEMDIIRHDLVQNSALKPYYKKIANIYIYTHTHTHTHVHAHIYIRVSLSLEY